MGLSKGTAKWLKIGAGAAALGLSFTNPIGWCADLSGVAAVGANVASGVVMGAVGNKLKKGADKAIDDHTDKSSAKPSAQAKATDKSQTASTAASSASGTDVQSASDNASPVSAASTAEDSASSKNPLSAIENLLSNLFGGDAVNSNGQSVSSTLNKFGQDSSQVQANSGKNLQTAAQTNGLSTDGDLKVHEL